MANQTMLLNTTRTRPCPLLLPPPSRVVCSSGLGFTPRTDLFHCLSITHHRHQPPGFPTTTTQQKQAFSKNKQTKLYGSLDNEEGQEYCSIKEEEEWKIENKKQVDESRKWSSINKVYFLLAAQYLLYVVVCATIAINPLIRAFFDQTLPIMAILHFSMIPLIWIPKMKFLKPIFYGLFIVSGSVLNGLILTEEKVAGRIVFAASVLTLAMVSALTKLTFWASQNGKKLGFFRFLSLACSSIFLYVLYKQKGEVGSLLALLGIVDKMCELIYTTGSLQKLSEDKYIKTCFVLQLVIYLIFLLILQIML